ncbi:MAG: hypothetical protein JXO22_15770, partial [Phycisphaerae bacterium]|nr:hypothetical protein [Phycisphaerae bacterium]
DFDYATYDNGASATVGYQLDINTAIQYSYNTSGALTAGKVLSLRTPEPPSLDENDNGVPDECEGQLGDLNCDGATDVFDIDAFVMAIIDPTSYAIAYEGCDISAADCNADGQIDIFDIDAFVVVITGE